jgi:hypothetical protein
MTNTNTTTTIPAIKANLNRTAAKYGLTLPLDQDRKAELRSAAETAEQYLTELRAVKQRGIETGLLQSSYAAYITQAEGSISKRVWDLISLATSKD